MIQNNSISSPSPIIEIRKLMTSFGEQVIHKDLDLDIYPGEILAIAGGSGTGKTTLLRVILMLQTAVAGSIKIFGKEILNHGETTEIELRRSWGMMFQQGALFSALTVLENVCFPLVEETKLDKDTIEQIAKLKLSMVGLPLNAVYKFPSELSGGMQKRVALARAIVLDPQILFLDEPTAGLDPQGASALDELILNLKNNLGLTIVMVTHDLDTLWRVTDRVAFLGDGKVLQAAPMQGLYVSKIPLVYDYFNDPRSKAAKHILNENSK